MDKILKKLSTLIGQDDLNQCESCGQNIDSEELHPCPYSEEIRNDSTPACNCCSNCTRECANDI